MWSRSIGRQSKIQITSPAPVTNISVARVMYIEFNAAGIRRVKISRIETKVAAINGKNMTELNSPEKGFVTNAMPIKPIITAIQRSGTTFSLRISAANSVDKIGEVQVRVLTVAIGIKERPVIKHKVAHISQLALPRFILVKASLGKTGIFLNLRIPINSMQAIDPRTNNTWPIPSDSVMVFTIASLHEIKVMASMIKSAALMLTDIKNFAVALYNFEKGDGGIIF